MIRIEPKKFVRITKQLARKRYAGGKKIYLCSCNMNPDHPCGGAVEISENNVDFNKLINEYRYYNCDHERGYYVNFYIRKTEDPKK